MTNRRIGWLIVAAAFVGLGGRAEAQFQTRWRDQRPQTSRPSPFLSLLATGTNRAVVYQGFVRPQLDLQSQVRTQDRQIDRVMTMTRDAATSTLGRRTAQTSSPALAAAQGGLGLDLIDRIRSGGGQTTQVQVGHPAYFQYRDQYFPGFRRLGGGGTP